MGSEILENFAIAAVADVDKAELIKREGVKQIHLSTTMYKVVSDRASNQIDKRRLSEELRAWLANRLNLSPDDEDLSNVSVELVLKRGRRAATDLIEQAFSTTSFQLLNDPTEGGWTIETARGKFFGPEKLRLSKSVRLERHGTSVRPFHVWDAMNEYLNELHKARLIGR